MIMANRIYVLIGLMAVIVQTFGQKEPFATGGVAREEQPGPGASVNQATAMLRMLGLYKGGNEAANNAVYGSPMTLDNGYFAYPYANPNPNAAGMTGAVSQYGYPTTAGQSSYGYYNPGFGSPYAAAGSGYPQPAAASGYGSQQPQQQSYGSIAQPGFGVGGPSGFGVMPSPWQQQPQQPNSVSGYNYANLAVPNAFPYAGPYTNAPGMSVYGNANPYANSAATASIASNNNVSPYGQLSTGQPAQLTFGQPPQMTFGQPAQVTYGQPAQMTYGQQLPLVFGQQQTAATFGQQPTQPCSPQAGNVGLWNGQQPANDDQKGVYGIGAYQYGTNYVNPAGGPPFGQRRQRLRRSTKPCAPVQVPTAA